MTNKLSKFIIKLSEEYDPKSKDTYVSLYLNRDSNKKFIDNRVRACKSILKGDELNIFSSTMKDIFKILYKNTGHSIAIFASQKFDFLEYITFSVKIKDLLVVDSSPYLRPLAMIQDEWESFTLLLINSN